MSRRGWGLSWSSPAIQAIKSNIETASEQQQEALRNSLREAAEELEFYAELQAPRDTGYLEEMSHHIEEQGYGEFEVIFSATAKERAHYIGADPPENPDFNYAWIQHENLEFKHTKGKAKYLSDPFEEHMDEWFEKAAAAVAKVEIPIIKTENLSSTMPKSKKSGGKRSRAKKKAGKKKAGR